MYVQQPCEHRGNLILLTQIHVKHTVLHYILLRDVRRLTSVISPRPTYPGKHPPFRSNNTTRSYSRAGPRTHEPSQRDRPRTSTPSARFERQCWRSPATQSAPTLLMPLHLAARKQLSASAMMEMCAAHAPSRRRRRHLHLGRMAASYRMPCQQQQ